MIAATTPAVVRDLVRGIAESGEWADTHRVDAAKVVAPYFRQDEALIRYVLTQPPDRVSYRMLTPGDDEMQRIADMALEAGILERRLDVRGLVDRQFIPADITAAQIDMAGAKCAPTRRAEHPASVPDHRAARRAGRGRRLRW